ncbi:MAG: type II toxin-antitoxin system VapC family toxin [Thiobacillus sp.]
MARNRPPSVAERFAHAVPGSLGISLITWGELCFGADTSSDPKRAHERLARFIADVPVHIPGPDTGLRYGEVRATQERAGTPIGNNDLWIAAHARALGVTLIGNNLGEFERVPGLKQASLQGSIRYGPQPRKFRQVTPSPPLPRQS